jgi:TatD DNase family protein
VFFVSSVDEVRGTTIVRLFDAHNHLHDARLPPHRETILAELARIGLERAVVNGTREEDWDAVTELAATNESVISSYGLHPWHVAARSPHWLERLRALLVAHPHAGVGEIGLDRWIEGHDLAVQTEVCAAQLALATELNRPATLHCIRAWGPLRDLLRSQPLPKCGFLLHAYGGPQEMVAGFVKLGAYFSFSPYFLHERKAAQREVFRHLPADRILVETDAPDLRPPDERNPRPLLDEQDEPINHPANIDLAHHTLAELRGITPEALAGQIAENFARLFAPS